MSNKLVKSDIKLTIGMLVSNHKEYIRKAMEAIKPLLDAVPSELIVVDTMGDKTDGSIAIVREYTDKVYPFTWCDDFSAARNVCMQHARGEWFLYQDDDEWFEDVTEFIEFFKSGACDKFYSGYYYTRDYMADGSYSMGIAGRMVRRTEDTRFVGRVHETFNETFAPNKEFSCFTHHFGYAYADDATAKKKQERNLTILKKELAEVGFNAKICAQITQELMQREETSVQGVEFAKDAVLRAEKRGELSDSSVQWMLAAIVRHYTRENDYVTVRRQAEYVERHYALSHLAQLTLAATVAGSAFAAGQEDEVIRRVDQYLEQWDWKQANEEEALMETQLDFPRFYDKMYYYRMLHIGAVSCNHTERYEQANLYWKRIPWKETGFDGSVYAADLNTTIKGLKKAKEEKEREEKKRVLFELCEMLLQAGAAAGQYLYQGAFDAMVQFLAQMQETSILLGGEIDKFLGEDNRETALLSQYCEKVWQCSQAETVREAEDHLAGAEELIKETKQALQEDTEKKRKVVFLPYKASMWDSLESVWRAAAEDKSCVAYVVPIPYYDKNPDGSFGAFHYEIDEFPKDVPVVRCEEFDLCVERPDVIFIHNPYDEYNRVTSVHPKFYSTMLKKFTGQLVYVPYYVSIGKSDVEFVSAPGVKNADKIYVSSEEVRETFVTALNEMKEKGVDGYYNLDKIIVAGSPKVDRVEYYIAHPELCECPEEWKPVLYRNGEKRKSLLLNTSLGDMLRHGQVHVDGIKRAIEEFKHREDCVLWWRPHPLIKATLEFVQPEVYQQYVALEEQYLEENIGIFDTTEDVERAIVMTDGYYGVPSSSLVTMYGLTGKPILVHENNEEIYEHSAEDVASFHDFVKYGDYIYFSANNTNGLFRMHLETKESEYLGEFPGEDLIWHLHKGTVLVGSQIWFAPYKAKYLSVYDIETGEFIVKDILPEKEKSAKYGNILLYDKRVFLLPVQAEAILEINTETFFVKEHAEWISPIRENYGGNKTEGFIRNGAGIYKDELFLLPMGADIIVRINLETSQVTTTEIPYLINGINDAVLNESRLYILSRNRKSPIWYDMETCKFGKFPSSQGICDGKSFGNIMVMGRELYLTPGLDDKTVIIDLETGEIRESNQLEQSLFEKKKGNWENNYYIGKLLEEGKCAFSSANDNATVIFDVEKGNVERVKIYMPPILRVDFRCRDRSDSDSAWQYRLREKTKDTLSDFVSYVVAQDRYSKKQQDCYRNIFYHKEGKTCGQFILEDVLKKLQE